MVTRLTLVSVLILATTVSACGGGGDPLRGVFTALPPATAASYVAGGEVMVSAATLDEQGGTLAGVAGTPVEGVVVTVPAGALGARTTLSLGYDTGTFVNVPDDEQNVVLVLRSSGATSFNLPLMVEFPFADPTRHAVSYYIDASGQLEILPPLPLDRAAGRGGFITWHASNFTWMNASPDSPAPVYNRFDPSLDGFPIDNTLAVRYAPAGRCLGMTSFARWYKQKAGGGLASQFTSPVPTEVGDAPRSGQEIIATRAHNSAAFYIAQNQAPAMDLAEFIIGVKHALRLGAPAVMVGLERPSGPHAVLAIAFTDNQIALYDPNHPGVFKAMDYTLEPANVGYGEATGFGLFGNGELALNEQHQHLWDDAQVGFHGENETKVEVTSHSDGQKLSNTDVSLEGKVHSGQVLVSELTATVIYDDLTQSDPVTLPMPPDDDTFRLPLTLKKGMNYVSFQTRGYVAYQGVQDLPTAPRSFTLEVTDTPSVGSTIVVTFTSTQTSATMRVEESGSFSTHLAFDVNTAQVLQPGFDFTQCDASNVACDMVFGRSLDSLDIMTANPLPVTVEFHQKIYELDSAQNFVVTSYVDGQGSLSCEVVHLRIFVKPGGTAASHAYQVFVEPNGICVEGHDTTPMLEGKYKFFPDDTTWNDLTPEMLTLYRAFPYSTQLDRVDLLACETPPVIAAGAIEPWAKDLTAPGSWSSLGRIDGCVDSTNTTITETTTVALTLVP